MQKQCAPVVVLICLYCGLSVSYAVPVVGSVPLFHHKQREDAVPLLSPLTDYTETKAAPLPALHAAVRLAAVERGPSVTHQHHALASNQQGGRKLLTGFSSTSIQVLYSNVASVCPSSAGDWADIPTFGHLVSDNWICSNAPAAPIRGVAAQDFDSKPTLETYGFAAFMVPAKPSGSNAPYARLEGMNIQVVGSVSSGSIGNCRVDAVDIAIYEDSNGVPGTLKYDAKLLLPGDNGISSTFVWSSASSGVLSFDIVDLHPGNTGNPTVVELSFNTKYWVRIKLLVPYTGVSGTGKCFAYWAVNSAAKTGNKCLWEEAYGGGKGYSTVCLGALTSAIPAANQTTHSCFNGGAPGATNIRRCQSFRSSFTPPITCPLQLDDFNFAFYGFNAATCASAPSPDPSGGTWPGACAGADVGSLCTATCTNGGTATVECLPTGSYSSTIVGACNP